MGVTICALYPNRHGGYGDCDAEGSHQNTKTTTCRSIFGCASRGGPLRGRTVNGKIEAERLNGRRSEHGERLGDDRDR